MQSASQSKRKPRIVIVGGGFAGVSAAKALSGCDADVTIIDQRNHHIFQPLLYQVATGLVGPTDIAAPIRELAIRQKNLTVILAEVTGLTSDGRAVRTKSVGIGTGEVTFDYLVLAPGMQGSYFGHDEYARYAPGLKTLADAELVRAKVMSAFEVAEQTEGSEARKRLLTFALVGAGPTGVELAASIATLARATLRASYRRFDPGESRILLVEAGKRILPSFSEKLAVKAAKQLDKLGVEIMADTKVELVDALGVVVNGRRIECATVLWTAGVAAAPLLKELGAQTDRAGRILVSPNLEVPNRPGVFVVGDAASLLQDGKPLPGVAQTAMQQGHYVGQLICARVEERTEGGPFRYVDKGSMAVVGRNFAVLESRRVRSSGFFTYVIWGTIHLVFLPQFQSRLRVGGQWLSWLLTNRRSSLLIPQSRQEGAATAMPLVTSARESPTTSETVAG